VTAPVAHPDASLRLQTVAGWDVASLRGGLHAMTALDDGFPAWRARLDTVLRALEDDGYWSGPAAAQAGELLLRLSTEAAAVDAGFAASREECTGLVRQAGTAAERAAAALTLARTLPVPLDAALADDGTLAALVDRLILGPETVAPAVAMAKEALAAAAAAEAAAGRAEEVVGAAAATAWTGLPPGMCEPPAGGPAATARWWGALPFDAQLALVTTSPGTVGSADGVPAWARDRANRLALHQVVQDPRADDGERATARVVADVLATEDAAGRVAQLHLLDLAGDRVAVSFGDVDTADAVAIVVPGMNTTPADDLGGVAGDARDLAAAARGAGPGSAVAAIAWLGYRAPGTLSAVSRRAAGTGGALLDSALDGLAAARTAVGAPSPRTTVVGHSYGTVVLDEAADRPGRLAADAVVLLGSPGMEGDASDLEVPEVFDAASAADPVSWVGWFGTGTWSPAFGATGLPVEAGTGHSDYFDRTRPTLGAMGEVVVGRRAD
jgi:hypothetical protein